jgi:2-keto-4-pentenoate hydratase/2-oxohepta-3-ene-1,7-dioic acid hydratase in catechol pathway
MRLVSYTLGDQSGFAAVVGDGVIDLTSRWPGVTSVRSLIEAKILDEARRFVRDRPADTPLSDLSLLPPVVPPGCIWCIGVNYAERNEEHDKEYGSGRDVPKHPTVFCRTPTSLVGHGQPIERPRVSKQLDYEGEIALVIGKRGHRIAKERALEHIFGLTLCNEGTIRDWLRHGKYNNTPGKNFDKSGSLGPWIVTADEVDLGAPLELTTLVNGEVRQHDSTTRLMFPFDSLIAYISTFATLLPGDVIVTGTPTGAGSRFDPPRWLGPGDVVEVDVPGIGTLRNTIIDEPSLLSP